jgi:hypothetical protein
LLTKPCHQEKLRDFYERVRPAGPFWGPVTGGIREGAETGERDNLKVAAIGWLAAILATLSCLFGVGKLLLCEYLWGARWLAACGVGAVITLWSIRELTTPRKVARGESELRRDDLEITPDGN